MAKKSNIYTRTGDTGTTSLASGQRVPKTNTRLEAYGTLDELSSLVGLLVTYLDEEPDRLMMQQVQSDLFSLGSVLATDTPDTPVRCDITDDVVSQLEAAIDEADVECGAWRGFILPGGSRGAALAHVCRTVCRRLERRIYALDDYETLPPALLKYVNRLSDCFFVLAKKINLLQGVEEKIWRKRS